MAEVTAEDMEIFRMLERYVGPRILGENLGEDEDFVVRVGHGEDWLEDSHLDAMYELLDAVSYTHLTLPTKRIV